MSAFRPRQRNDWTTNPRSGDGGCYAIAKETSSISGIYFSHGEATKKILETRSQSQLLSGETGVNKNVDFRRFDKVRDAEAFLKDRGFAPFQSSGWISARNKSPILYTPVPCKERVETESVNHDENDNACTTTNGIEKKQNRRAKVTPVARSTVFTNTVMDKVCISGGVGRNDNDLRRLWSNHNHGTETEAEANEHTRESSLAEPSTRSVNVPPRREEESLSEPSFRSGSKSSPKLKQISPKASGFFQPGYKASPLREERRRARNDRAKCDLERERDRKRPRPGSGAENSVTASSGGGSSERSTSASASAAKLFASPPPDFDAVQQEAIDAAMAGKNVFVTGVAGTGKSLVTKVRTKKKRKKEGKKENNNSNSKERALHCVASCLRACACDFCGFCRGTHGLSLCHFYYVSYLISLFG